MRVHSRLVAIFGLVLLIGVQASAVPTTLQSVLDTPHCDVLAVPLNVDEIGNGSFLNVPGPSAPFPAGEQIQSGALGSTGVPAGTNCNTGSIDSPFIPNQMVQITNLTGVDYLDLWYVANPETNVSNLDGAINGYPAFKIDSVGVNKPLFFESILADGIFQSGETWRFVIQDFANAASPAQSPHWFGAIGVNSVPNPFAPDGSSGSIIGIAAPEPGTAGLLVMGLLALARRGRRSA